MYRASVRHVTKRVIHNAGGAHHSQACETRAPSCSDHREMPGLESGAASMTWGSPCARHCLAVVEAVAAVVAGGTTTPTVEQLPDCSS